MPVAVSRRLFSGCSAPVPGCSPGALVDGSGVCEAPRRQGVEQVAWWWWVGGLLLVIVGFRPARRALGRQIAKTVRRRATRRPRATSRPPARRRPARTPSTTPWKPVAPVPQPGVPAPKPLAWARPQRCSTACRRSRKPASTCDCACGGRDHGRYRPGTAAAIRAAPVTPAQKAARRRATEQAATDRWKKRQAAAQARAKPVTRGGSAKKSAG